jgi:hypothetical protein
LGRRVWIVDEAARMIEHHAAKLQRWLAARRTNNAKV